ncbi:MAG: glycosyltransferase family 2 protein [Anaerolineae bacterium]|nr:glycosyltransferase family 2 protein [Thermoflexales bacterium]MDW8408701.1 glycosyltransferase family 2 protein [Anaerolineae bacterium]
MNQPELGVIIVSWNVRDLLRTCLMSLLRETPANTPILVIDSASTDGTVAMLRNEFPMVDVTACADNIGYVRGNNLGLNRLGFAVPSVQAGSSTPPRFVWLLNPDTEVLPGAVTTLLDFMHTHPRCGLCGPKLINPDGSLQHGAFEFPGLRQLLLETQPFLWRFRGTRLDGRYPPALYDAGRPFPIGHPLGAAMLARAEAIAQVGPLDPGYEMYSEEVDWAMRMKQAGWERWCVPAAVVKHYGGASSSQANARAEQIKWRSRQRYYQKHYSPLKRRLALWLMPARFRNSNRTTDREE